MYDLAYFEVDRFRPPSSICDEECLLFSHQWKPLKSKGKASTTSGTSIPIRISKTTIFEHGLVKHKTDCAVV